MRLKEYPTIFGGIGVWRKDNIMPHNDNVRLPELQSMLLVKISQQYTRRGLWQLLKERKELQQIRSKR